MAGRIVLALVVGVIVTVLVSWVAMFVPWRTHWHGPPLLEDVGLTRASDGTKTWQITRGSNAWHTVVGYWWMQVSGMSFMMAGADYDQRAIELDALPSHLRPATVDGMVMQAWYHETGWPMPAMTCSVHWVTQVRNANIIYAVEGGVQLPRDAQFNPRALPLRPLLPGFIVNALFWAVLALAPMNARSLARRLRGRCPKCGYPRTGRAPGSACPECGAA